jgi:hypothetical protein
MFQGLGCFCEVFILNSNYLISLGEVYDPDALPSKVSLRHVVSHNPRPSTCPLDDPAYLISHLPKPKEGNSSPTKSPQKNAVMPVQLSPCSKRKSYSPSLLRRSFFNRQSKSRQDLTEEEEKCEKCGFLIKDEIPVSVAREENKRDIFHKTCFKCSK